MQQKPSENQQIIYEEFESKVSQELESVMFKNALLDSSNNSSIMNSNETFETKEDESRGKENSIIQQIKNKLGRTRTKSALQ